MAIMDDTAQRIGKIDMTIRVTEEGPDVDERHRRRVESLTRYLVAQWRLEHGEATN